MNILIVCVMMEVAAVAYLYLIISIISIISPGVSVAFYTLLSAPTVT